MPDICLGSGIAKPAWLQRSAFAQRTQRIHEDTTDATSTTVLVGACRLRVLRVRSWLELSASQLRPTPLQNLASASFRRLARPHGALARRTAVTLGVVRGLRRASSPETASPDPSRSARGNRTPASSWRISRAARARRRPDISFQSSSDSAHRAIELELLDRPQRQHLFALERDARALTDHHRAIVLGRDQRPQRRAARRSRPAPPSPSARRAE